MEDLRKAITETYFETRRLGHIPSLAEVQRKTEFNINRKAWDVIYGLNERDITRQVVSQVLKRERLAFWSPDGKLENDPQVKI